MYKYYRFSFSDINIMKGISVNKNTFDFRGVGCTVCVSVFSELLLQANKIIADIAVVKTARVAYS